MPTNGVVVATVNGDIDLSNDMGRLAGRILASVARDEVERSRPDRSVPTDSLPRRVTAPGSQGHLKAVFTKTVTSSRRELLALSGGR